MKSPFDIKVWRGSRFCWRWEVQTREGVARVLYCGHNWTRSKAIRMARRTIRRVRREESWRANPYKERIEA